MDVATKQITARMQVPVGAQAIRASPDGKLLYAGDFHRPLLHILDCEARVHVRTVPLTGVPGWPFMSRDGEKIIVTTYDEPADRGFVELLDARNPEERTVIDVPSEPFHALPLRDDRHALVALASGEIVKIDLVDGKLTGGGFSAGGTMPETLLYLN